MSGRSGPFWDGVEGRATATAQVISLIRAPAAA